MDYTPTLDLDNAPVERSDMELVELTRFGDTEAFGELWTRHYHAAIRAARSISFNHEAEDLAQEAFMRIYHTIREGHGPREVFRAYLYTVLRSVSMNWDRSGSAKVSLDSIEASQEPAYSFEGQVIDASITASAFATLKPEWRAVLWYLDVEEMTPKEVSPMLGLSANATSALAYRAREGLRSAWLQAHLNSDTADDKCKWTVERLGDYNRGALTSRQKNKLQEHLTTCLKCSILVEEIDQLSKTLSIVLLPMLLGPQAFSYMNTIGQSSFESVTAPPNPVENTLAGASKLGFAIIASAITAGGIIAASIFIFNAPPRDTALNASEPSISVFPSTSQPSQNSTFEPADPESPASHVENLARSPKEDNARKVAKPQSDTATFAGITPAPQSIFDVPSRPGEVPNNPVRASPGPIPLPAIPTAPVTQPTSPAPSQTLTPSPTASPVPSPTLSAPATPVKLSTPSIDSITEAGLLLPVLNGSGVPYATVTVVSAGDYAGSAVVDAAGLWTVIPEVTLASNMPVSFSAYQSQRGQVSDTTAATEPVSVLMPGMGSITYSNGTGNVSFSGPDGSRVEVLIDGVSTGNWHLMDGNLVVRRLPLLAPGQHSLTLRFIDPDSSRHGAGLHMEFSVSAASL